MTNDTKPDYPAAHSMDTTWFAVDADGHVGVFSSDAEGAVPLSAQGDDAFLDALMLDAQEYLWQSGRIRGRHCTELQAPYEHDFFDVLLFLHQPPEWSERPDWSKQTVRPITADSGQALYAVRTDYIGATDYQKIHDNGLCAGCCSVERMEDATRLGLFYYDCTEWGPNPYVRLAAPESPLRFEDLPPALRAACRPAQLPVVRFESAERVQPLEHVPCKTWGDPETFGASDGHSQVPMPPKQI